MIEDARARQRRHRAVAFLILAAIAVGALIMGFGGGGAGLRATRHEHGRGPNSATGSSSTPRPVVLLHGLENPQAYAAGGRVYVSQQVSRPGAVVVSELMRVNPLKHHLLATRKLASAYQQALLSGNVLWVTTASARTAWLWRLDRDSLTVLSRRPLPGLLPAGPTFGTFGSMAVAAGWLWVGGWDSVDRVSLGTGRITKTVAVPDAQGIDVAANAAGTVLIDSEGHERARVQRRDPHTGWLLAQSPVYVGVAKPFIGGVSDGGVWISESGGMSGYVQRLSVVTLKPTTFGGAQPHPGITAPPTIWGTNGLAARVIDGTLWITQSEGPSSSNYCGSATTGRAHATLRLGGEANLLTVSQGSMYYVPNTSRQTGQQLDRTRVSSRC